LLLYVWIGRVLLLYVWIGRVLLLYVWIGRVLLLYVEYFLIFFLPNVSHVEHISTYHIVTCCKGFSMLMKGLIWLQLILELFAIYLYHYLQRLIS